MSGKKRRSIRPLALGIFWHPRRRRILAARGADPGTGAEFYRPIGGRIEFGETSAACLVREVKEELGEAAEPREFLGVLENIFTYDGRRGHEICLLHEARFADPAVYQAVERIGRDGRKILFRAHWIDPWKMDPGIALYPDGLRTLLERSARRR